MSEDVRMTLSKIQGALNTIMFSIQILSDEINKLVSRVMELELKLREKEKEGEERRGEGEKR